VNLLLANPWLFSAAGLLLDAIAICAVLAWYRYQPRHRRDHGHTGAYLGWSPAAEVAAVEQDTALLTTAEQMALDHQALDGIGAAIDKFDEHMSHALRMFLRATPGAYLEVVRWGSSTLAATDTFDRRELDAMLAADGRDLVPAGAR
jgi:hypothetical protein